MKIAIFSLIFGFVAASPAMLQKEWKTWKKQHGKDYGSRSLHRNSLEEIKRMNIWMANTDMIREHNLAFSRGEHTYSLKMNKFGDLTTEEFTSQMNGYRSMRTLGVPRSGAAYMVHSSAPLPSSVDWRQEGAVSPVKDQGQCGSCWAFSATGALESAWYLSKNEMVSLSEQDIMDCSKAYGNMGCEGGDTEQAFKYIQAAGGVDTEQSYPYTARDGSSCKFMESEIGATEAGMTAIKRGDEDELKSAVANMGPVAIAIDASQNSFQFYSSGVYSDSRCGNSMWDLDHAVLAVGYGTEGGQDYWLVKNSWAESWGDEGYIKMKRNANNMCGVATEASVPLVK